MTYSDKMTEIMLLDTEDELHKAYAQASKELRKTASKYFETFKDRFDEEYAAYQKGAYTRSEFQSWYMSQIGRGQRWDDLKKDLANLAKDTNIKASEHINRGLADVYDLNANYTAYEIERATGVTSFTLVKTDASNILASGSNHVNFKVLSVNPIRDYQWNDKQIQGALLQGILQGDSISHITDRFMQVMKNNRNAAIRNARTAYTSAQNAGTNDTMAKAADMGIKTQKEWIATSDDRTRDSHAELDGVRVGYNDPFPNGLDYPGDPTGAPEEVYNCRCTIRAVLHDINDDNRYSEIEGHEGYHDKKSYEEWLKDKNNDEFTENKTNVNINFGAESAGGTKKVYFNENASYRIDINEFQEKINDEISKAAKEVAELGSETGYEYAVLIDTISGAKSIVTTDGLPNSVRPDYSFCEEHKNVFFVHNHNEDTSLSLPDINEIVSNESFAGIAAVRNDGISYAVVSNGIHDYEYLFSKYIENGTKQNICEELLNEKGFVDASEVEKRIVEVAVNDYCVGGIRTYV